MNEVNFNKKLLRILNSNNAEGIFFPVDCYVICNSFRDVYIIPRHISGFGVRNNESHVI